MWMWLCVNPRVTARGSNWEWFGDLPQLPEGTAMPVLLLPGGAQVLCQPGVCSAGGLGDGLNKDRMFFGREGSALPHETLVLPTLFSCWQYRPVVVRALGGGDWYSRSDQAVDLAMILAIGSPLCAFPQQGLSYPFIESQAIVTYRAAPTVLCGACLPERVHCSWWN